MAKKDPQITLLETELKNKGSLKYKKNGDKDRIQFVDVAGNEYVSEDYSRVSALQNLLRALDDE